jgi:exodeoxyribonuclease VII large subunit
VAFPDDVPSLSDLRARRGAPVKRPSGRGSPSAARLANPDAGRGPSLFDSALAPSLEIEDRPPATDAYTPSRDPDQPSVSASRPYAAEARIWSVGDLVRQVRGLVEHSYGQVSVEGEISNWRPAASGHCYFTLKDREAQLSAVLFRRQAALLRFRPKDGDAVRLRGQLSVYESRGQMQLIAETMEQQGLGALLAAVRELKERLRREGLFDRKRPLPSFPRCIGVVTSLQGAALRDIVKVCRRRHAAVNLLIYPAAVQGPRCAAEVSAGVRWFSEHPERADVVLVARGGGSWEDLHGFDDEQMARTIVACSVPVIVGIGHATDSTIADAAADVCAPTPSAAAELVTAAQYRVDEQLERLQSRLQRAGRYEVLRARQNLSGVGAQAVLQRVRDAIGQRAQRIDELEFRAQAALLRRLRALSEELVRLDSGLRRQHPALRLADSGQRLQAQRLRLDAAQSRCLTATAARLERASSRLETLSPLRVLERGYALVYGPDGRLLRSAAEVGEGDELTAQLARGRLRARVIQEQ